MGSIRYPGQYKKDFKRMEKRGVEVKKLRAVIEKQVNEDELEAQYKAHPLVGEHAGGRDCRISPDWILNYASVGNELRLIRTGRQAGIFK